MLSNERATTKRVQYLHVYDCKLNRPKKQQRNFWLVFASSIFGTGTAQREKNTTQTNKGAKNDGRRKPKTPNANVTCTI